jgi:hypothetical protein
MDRRQRLEAFRQLKSELRGSEMYLLVGIDVAKDRHQTPLAEVFLFDHSDLVW